MVSATFKESAFAPETEDVWLVLLTIDHDELSEPIRVVNNQEDIESGGHTFTAYPFEIVLPADTEDGPPAARLRIDNVSQEIAATLRTISTPGTVDFKVVLSSAPDTAEREFTGMTLRNVAVTMQTITGVVGLDDLRLEPFPVDSFGPTFFPGLY